MKKSFKTKGINSLDDLLNIINHLRDPKHGCEWDIKQTAKTLSPNIIEEAYELVEALESESIENIIDENAAIITSFPIKIFLELIKDTELAILQLFPILFLFTESFFW